VQDFLMNSVGTVVTIPTWTVLDKVDAVVEIKTFNHNRIECSVTRQVLPDLLGTLIKLRICQAQRSRVFLWEESLSSITMPDTGGILCSASGIALKQVKRLQSHSILIGGWLHQYVAVCINS
jgi:hypothetical protein